MRIRLLHSEDWDALAALIHASLSVWYRKHLNIERFGPDPGAIIHFGSEEDLIKILQNPSTSMACDCGASTEARVHPRFYGSFPRVLGRYVRELKIMSWEQAIRQSSWLFVAGRIRWWLPRVSGERRSEVREEGRLFGPGDMSGAGHPASSARAPGSQSFQRPR